VSSGSIDAVRQTAHWESAVRRLAAFDELASPVAWASLETYLGVSIRRSMGDALRRLKYGIAELRAGATPEGVHKFRQQYTLVESVLDFFVDAINTRGSTPMAARLRTCDWLASESMAKTLTPLGVSKPPVLVYVDKGLGAAILKAGLRLWDGATDNPAAAIKVTLHNMSRPTALIHEAGHQVAHLLGWNKELASRLEDRPLGAWRVVGGVGLRDRCRCVCVREYRLRVGGCARRCDRRRPGARVYVGAVRPASGGLDTRVAGHRDVPCFVWSWAVGRL